MALVWNKNHHFKKVAIKNAEDYEMLVCAGSLPGHSRKVVVVCCYIPPNYVKKRGEGAVEHLVDVLVECKRRFKDPYIVVAGDLNQWRVDLGDFADIEEVQVGHTRGDKSIDRIFTNFPRKITESGTLAPLENESEDDVRRSDHRTAFAVAELQRREAFRWEVYSYRHYSSEAVEKFKHWIALYEWEEVFQAEGAERKAEEYQRALTVAIEDCFPLKKRKKKSTDLPWMTRSIIKQIEDRKELYVREGGVRTDEWKAEKKKTNDLIKKSKRGYMDNQRDHLLAEDADRNFFKHVKNFSRLEKPPLFDVRELGDFKGMGDEAIAEDLATYFNRISSEFSPLSGDDIPITYGVGLPPLRNYEVASRIRRFRKPKSMVPGDIFPQLMTQFADQFALPLTNIYNEMTRTGVWPTCWKREFVTVIPKGTKPTKMNDLRNISCLLLASKMYESYVLDWLKGEVKLRDNQFGGVKGFGTQHVLVQLYQRFLENAEDYRAATMVTSIDYSKALNRMSFQYCLKALAKNGASSPVLRLVAAFLTGRTMSVKVGQELSRPREVHGGCPQGSILGVFLFNATIDDLEEDCEDVLQRKEKSEALPYPSMPAKDPELHELPQESPIVKPSRPCKRLDYSCELRYDIPPEVNDVTEARWVHTLALLLRYIDDGFSLSKINFENSMGFMVNGVQHRIKHAIQSQNVFRHLVRRAEDIGMVVNAQKTTMVCVSDATSYEADGFILDVDQERIGCQETFKALGMRFSNKPNVDAHVDFMEKSVRSRLWTISCLLYTSPSPRDRQKSRMPSSA